MPFSKDFISKTLNMEKIFKKKVVLGFTDRGRIDNVTLNGWSSIWKQI